ncbi:MAG: PucR family transcriptional regulator ligand-binding domain-containing protein [Streptosporangiaceae bacterium]|nr:PucR family transcriptional regulator ligand-binding domain-containing protein [Streptosporangiaceae bacterium]
MRVRDLLDVPGLGLRLLTDVTGLDRPIKHVYTTDLPDPGRYLTRGDLVLTGMIWCREPGDADRFVRALTRAGASVLGAGEALGPVPREVIDACGRHGVTLLAVPPETSFATVTDEVGRRLSGDRATAMTRVLGRRRLLLSAVAEGAGLDEMFRLMSREIGVRCWLLTGTGQVVGGTGAPPPRSVALRLAAEYVKAGRLPAVTRPLGDDYRRYTLFAVGGEPRITSWFLACAGLTEGFGEDVTFAMGAGGTASPRDSSENWPHELRESVAELAADVALERARLDAGRAGERKLAEAIVTRLATEGSAGLAEGSSPAEIASLMRAAGLPPDGGYLIAALRTGAVATGAVATGAVATETGAAGHWRCALAEDLVLPHAGNALTAPLGDEIIAIIPVGPHDPPEPAEDGHPAADGHPAEGGIAAAGGIASAQTFAASIREALPVFEADRSRLQVSVGVSTPVAGVTALAGALHEARSARRLAAGASAAAHFSALAVVTSDEVASHELLLASVPPSVLRSFRERLLGPLLAYDQQHRAELESTLREFLACSGSWNACAAKMYVHVNTVRYRIRRIEELTGRDLSSLDDRVDFFLALRVR